MTASTASASDALIRVMRARQGRLWSRMGFVCAVGLLSVGVTGWVPVAYWAAGIVIQQAFELVCLPRTAAEDGLSPGRSAWLLVLIFTGNMIFNGIGAVYAEQAGGWGLAFGCVLWSASFGLAAISNAGSGPAVVAYVAPSAVYFLSVPFFVVRAGGPLHYAWAILIAGLLHGLATLELWSVTDKRLKSEKQERLANHLARHDPETGLPNRLAFEEAIAAQVAREPAFTVGLLGIDRFPDLRGAIGYALVARLIMEVTKRLGGVHSGIIAHVSAAALGVIVDAPTQSEARAHALALQAAMATPVIVDGIEIDVSFTIGLAMRSEGDGTSRLLERASIALSGARKARVGVTIFEPALDTGSAGNLSLMPDMLRSMERGEITNHYQPKYDLRSGQVAAVEALVRWHHPERGTVPPDEFIPLAEETGRIRELTLDVLSRAIRDQAWLAERGHALPFAVNLSGRLLGDADIMQTIIDLARPAAAGISVEVTETAMMAHPEVALPLLRRLRSAGIGVSIDDYGSGLSSLGYLKNIPADELKMDRSFVTHMDRDRQDCLLVRSTIALAHGLGLRVVAEGVESGRTLEILGQMNRDMAQGYHMARPMPLVRLAELLESGAELGIAGGTLPVMGIPEIGSSVRAGG